jgi:pyruvoyl-dependent arginine decarboxylase (PvlArgDC)
MGNLPTRFWIAQGFGVDDEDKVNAYDNALYHMGLADQNMRYVSSVPPQTQLFDVLTRNGYSYIPIPEDWLGKHREEFQMWRKYGQIVSKEWIPQSKDGKDVTYDWYFLMGTSWCTDVVMTEMRGDSGEYLASGLGIGQYKKHDDTLGTFAFENHGYVDSESCADKTVEGIIKMIEMRGHEVIPRVEEVSGSNVITQKYPVGTLQRNITGTEITRYAKKEVFLHDEYQIDAYVTSMVVPEGHCGVVLTACVFDPFTEVRALAPSIWR